MATKQGAFTYTVTGKGKFPVDMLRYDECWPRGPGDADVLTESIQDTANRAYLVRIHSQKPPTRDRWASFGWKVA